MLNLIALPLPLPFEKKRGEPHPLPLPFEKKRGGEKSGTPSL